HVGPLPGVSGMSQAVVEDAPFAVVPRPDDREILVLSVYTFLGKFDLVGVETHEHADVVARVVFDLIDLVLEGKPRRQMLHAGEPGIFDHEGGIEYAPWVAVEVAANHLAVLGPGHERDRRAMNPDESLAVIANE